MSIQAKSSANEGLTIHSWPSNSPPRCLLVSAGERVRQTFLVWPGSCSEEGLASVLLDVKADRPLTVDRAQINSVKLPHAVLADTRLQSQARVVDSINQAIDRWRSGGSSFSGLLMAPPGLGKSHIVARIRQRCYTESMHEVF